MSDDHPAHVDADLERQVLGQVLAFPSVYTFFVGQNLEAEDFFRPIHRMIWLAICAVFDRGQVADLVSVGAELRAIGRLEEIQPSYLAALMDGMPKPAEANAVLAVARLQELAALRLVASAGLSLNADVLRNAGSLEDGTVAAHVATIEAALTARSSGPRVLDVFGQIGAYLADACDEDAPRLTLGLEALDGILGGLRPGEVCGLMARPGIGKTNVFCHAIRHLAAQQVGHVCFSLEMPAAQITERILRGLYEVGRDELRYSANKSRIDWASAHQTLAPFALVDTPGLSVAQMSGLLRQAQLGVLSHTRVRVVSIDHLGLIGGDRKMSTYDRVSTQARELKEFAKRHSVVVLLAIQVNREAGGDGSRELGLGAARDSGVVEEAMDYLLAMRRLDRSLSLSVGDRDRYRDVLFVKVVKHRHGDPGDELAYRLNTRTLRFTEAPDVQANASNDIARIAEAASSRRR